MRTFTITLLACAALGAATQLAGGTDATCGSTSCCDRCGHPAACVEKTCQVVCEMKKETKTCWCVEYKEICPLMPGCHDSCDGCPPPPRCGNPKCVKKLVKKEYQVETPVYKCVVRNLCRECLDGSSIGNPPSAAPTPPAPSSAPLPPTPPAPSPPARVTR
jgi:hypothetical protein